MEAAVSAPPPSPSEVLSRIERDLRALWDDPSNQEAPKSRVCTLNLVVVAPTEEAAERYTAVVDEVTSFIPARAIVVALDPTAKVIVQGEVTAVCMGSEGARQICSERIRLTLASDVGPRTASAVSALLVPDIETVLVWVGQLSPEDPGLRALARQADRIVVDSEYTGLSKLFELCAWTKSLPETPSVIDLAWLRLSPWRELLARTFDSEEFAAHAEAIDTIHVVQAEDEPPPRLGSEAALLFGWLASRLNWRFVTTSGVPSFQRPDGSRVALSLASVPRPKGVAPLALAQVHVTASSLGTKLECSVDRSLASGLEGTTRDADVMSWSVSANGTEALHQVVRMRTNKGARLLERAIRRPLRDEVLDTSIAVAAMIPRDETALLWSKRP